MRDPGGTVSGVAYCLAGSPQQQAAALEYLEWREKQYDQRLCMDVHSAGGQVRANTDVPSSLSFRQACQLSYCTTAPFPS